MMVVEYCCHNSGLMLVVLRDMCHHDVGGLLRQAERKIFLQKEMMDWEVRVTWTGTVLTWELL